MNDKSAGASFAVRVEPRASKTGIRGTLGDALKVAVAAPPNDGRANDELIELFSRIFRVPRSTVQILAGGHTRNKIVRIAGRSAAELELALREHFIV